MKKKNGISSLMVCCGHLLKFDQPELFKIERTALMNDKDTNKWSDINKVP